MNDLSKTVAEVLASELADPEAIAALIRETEEELASLEAKLADAEAKVLVPIDLRRRGRGPVQAGRCLEAPGQAQRHGP